MGQCYPFTNSIFSLELLSTASFIVLAIMSSLFSGADSRAYLRPWLLEDDHSIESYASPDIQQIYREALDRFGSEMAKKGYKVDLTSSASSIQEIHNTVERALAAHADRHKHSTVRRWLNTVKPSVSHYSSLMNVLGKHHPEYLGLMWGVMKIVFDVSLTPYFWLIKGSNIRARVRLSSITRRPFSCYRKHSQRSPTPYRRSRCLPCYIARI